MKVIARGFEREKRFLDQNVRTFWDKEGKQWLFCYSDVVKAVSQCKDPQESLKKLRKYHRELNAQWEEMRVYVPLITNGGIQQMQCGNSEGVVKLLSFMRARLGPSFIRWMNRNMDEPIDFNELTNNSTETV